LNVKALLSPGGHAHGEHARRWPDDANHCAALRNGAVELDRGGKHDDSAALYLAFGSHAACAKQSPNAAVLALHRAGKLFLASVVPPEVKVPAGDTKVRAPQPRLVVHPPLPTEPCPASLSPRCEGHPVFR